MGSWGSHVFKQEDYNRIANLLSPKAKQATLAAVSKFGVLRQGTWNGCVFNAAGKIEGVDISDYRYAAEIFDMSEADVRTFISKWDSMKSADIEATQKLKDALLSDSEALTGKSTEVVYVVHESEMTKMQREFEKMVEDLDIPMDERSVEQQEFASDVASATELLFA